MEVQDLEQFNNVQESISAIAKASDLMFIPVNTNIITIGPEDPKDFWGKFWLNEYMSAAFAAIAHTFSNRWHSFSVNASHDIPNLIPHGSNPLLTQCYSTWGMPIKEEGIHFSRFQKVKLIASWDVALQNMRVCNDADFDDTIILNCGKCEKCVRTMLALEAVGALHKATAFPVTNITQDLVAEAVYIQGNTFQFYNELLVPLVNIGRDDLSNAIRSKITGFKRSTSKRKIEPVIDFDKKHLNGSLKKLKNLTVDKLSLKLKGIKEKRGNR
jgi:hypothetical protein